MRCPWYVFVALFCVACGKSAPLGIAMPQPVAAESPAPTFSSPAPSALPSAEPTPYPTPSTMPADQTFEVVKAPPPAPSAPPLFPSATLSGTPGVTIDQDGTPTTGTALYPLGVTVVDPNITGFSITIAKSIPEGVSCTTTGPSLSCLFPRPGAYSLVVTVASTNAISILTIRGINVIAVAANPYQGTYVGTCTTRYKDATPGLANVQMLVATNGTTRLTTTTPGFADAPFSGNARESGIGLSSPGNGGLSLGLTFVLKDRVPTGATGSGGGIGDRNYTYTCALNHTKLMFPTP